MSAQVSSDGRPEDYGARADAFRFYAEGYESGHAHGRLHGLFEGRALGQEKAWEIWEEVGFYEGFAEYWLGVLGGEGQTERGGTKGKEAR